MKKGFDADKYVFAQSLEIRKRVAKFGRLYLEVGGKLCFDRHAARVLPGYRESCKVEILKELGSTSGHDSGEPDLDIVYCVSAKDLVSGREVGLSGLSYGEKVLRDLKDIEGNFCLRSGSRRLVAGCRDKIRIVVTRFSGEDEARKFVKKLKGYRVYFHDEIEDYGVNLAGTLRGYDRNSYVKLDSDLVIVTGPGSGSGKMGFALSQIYHERKKKLDTGFAKFESFPIWNLPMNHPVNLAYEAATADLGDFNVIDKFHLRAYGKRAVNYNRDVENFLILRKVLGKRFPFGYKSVTDMGVNMMRVGIVDDGVVRRAGVREIRRRFKKSKGLERERILRIVGKIGPRVA